MYLEDAGAEGKHFIFQMRTVATGYLGGCGDRHGFHTGEGLAEPGNILPANAIRPDGFSIISGFYRGVKTIRLSRIAGRGSHIAGRHYDSYYIHVALIRTCHTDGD